MVESRPYLVLLVMLSTIAGCGPVGVGGKFAVATYSRETAEKVTPRVVIAFYDEDDRSHWGVAVGPEAAKTGISYPFRCFWRWGALEAYGWPSYFVFPGVCVLAEGYWPSIMSESVGPDTTDLPQDRWPGLAQRGVRTIVGLTEPIPAGCDGAWRILLIPSGHGYDELVQSYVLVARSDFLRVIDAALEKSKTLSPGDKQWAYGQLLHMVQAQLQIEKYAAGQSALQHWQEVFRSRAAK